MGEDVLYGRKGAQLSVIVREDRRLDKRKQENPQSVPEEEPQSEDRGLFEKLKELRRNIANEMHKPAYIVLPDKSLHSLASLKSTNLSQFGTAYGIGEYKETQFGDRFVELICSHLGAVDAPWTQEEENALLFLWRQGKSIQELADILQRNTGSIRSRLKKIGRNE